MKVGVEVLSIAVLGEVSVVVHLNSEFSQMRGCIDYVEPYKLSYRIQFYQLAMDKLKQR